jgi:exo-beta-1,3-glucanase (GH17 family)
MNKLRIVSTFRVVCTAAGVYMAIHASAEPETLAQSEDSLLAGFTRGIAYSGFRTGQHPDRGDGARLPTDAQILEDLKLLEREGFDLIRLYDSQENSRDVLRIIRAEKIELKVLQGIWLKGELSNHEECTWVNEPVPQEELVRNAKSNLDEIERGIQLANEYSDIIIAVNVGNEALVTWNDHLVRLESMIKYVTEVKARIGQPVTTADNYEVFAKYGPKLADHLDFLGVHTYPLWENKTIDEGLAYTKQNLLKVHDAAPDKPIVITEAGWATVASEFPDRVSEDMQKRYYNELFDFCEQSHITLFWFEAFDEDWKGGPGNPYGVEKHWGLFNIDRTPKKAIAR